LYSKKSTLARQLVAEKDQTLTRVTQEVEELRSEVESGGHSERKIMALAMSQAQREVDFRIIVCMCAHVLMLCLNGAFICNTYACALIFMCYKG
jgi:hypothetical protein